jgi:hypothetical protein
VAAASDPARRLEQAIADAPPQVHHGPHPCAPGTHSRTADGRVVCWRPQAFGVEGDRWAIDAELADQPVPPTLARRWGSDDPTRVWAHWCVLEVVAKLTDVPVVRLSTRYGRVGDELANAGAVDDLRWQRWVADGLVVAAGLSPSPAAAGSPSPDGRSSGPG